MLRRLKKFTVYSSVIVAGQASRALDNAPFAGQDESEDAEDLLRLLSACDDDEVNIFGDCYDPDETFLNLNGKEISGPIPTEIGQLTALGYLSLSNNKITGSIPPEIGLLKKLEGLSLADNKITGTFPTEIGQLTALKSLYLNYNKITGTFPSDLCEVQYCYANYGNNLVAPRGTPGCCDLSEESDAAAAAGLAALAAALAGVVMLA